jgi:hypothetical protein
MDIFCGLNAECVNVEAGWALVVGPAVAQVVSRRLLTAEGRVGVQGTECGTCGGQSDTRLAFFFPIPVLPCQYHLNAAIYILLRTFSSLLRFFLNHSGFLHHIQLTHTVGLLWTSDQPVAEASTYTG